MEIDNAKELESVLAQKAESVIEEVADMVYKTLLDCIDEYIYNAPKSNWYERYADNGGFRGAFQWRPVTDKLTRELFYNYNSMVAPTGADNNQGYTHGDMTSYIDRREDLWWILDSSDFNRYESEFGGAKGMRGASTGYLELFNTYLQNDFWHWVEAAAKKQGLELLA